MSLLHWLKDNYKAYSETNSKIDAPVYAIWIDTKEIFTNKYDSKFEMSKIAWKAYALAASKSKWSTSNESLKSLCVYHWHFGNMRDLNNLKEKEIFNLVSNKTKLKRTIQKWLDSVGIVGEFEGSTYIIKGRKKETKQTVKETKPKTKKVVVEESVEEPKVETKEEIIEEVHEEDLRPDEIKLPIDWSLDFEKYQELPNYKQIDFECNQQFGSINSAVQDICEKYKVDNEMLKKASAGEYFDDKIGGLDLKNAIRADILKLRMKILNSQKITKPHKNLWKYNVARAYNKYPWIMTVN